MYTVKYSNMWWNITFSSLLKRSFTRFWSVTVGSVIIKIKDHYWGQLMFSGKKSLFIFSVPAGVRALCNPFKLFHSNLVKPCLYGLQLVHMLGQVRAFWFQWRRTLDSRLRWGILDQWSPPLYLPEDSTYTNYNFATWPPSHCLQRFPIN